MPPPKKPMPVGIEDFKEIVAGGYHFVDKTGFIKEHMDHRGQVTLITRPRRFGKTLTLSMLLYFYTLEQSEENRKLFCGLDIEKAGEQRRYGSTALPFMERKYAWQGKAKTRRIPHGDRLCGISGCPTRPMRSGGSKRKGAGSGAGYRGYTK